MSPKETLKPGTKVGVRYGGRTVPAFILQDRGILGGTHLVWVHVGDRNDPDAPEFEVPVEELKPVPAAA